ncbi:GAF domain-containing protein [Halostagnicola sp. A-GB9-2]|uniref:GAF domain-containing protein n=1 Tax=Halostagnicola sp. A-GB9-2 TaxID=3048066 RepID=UPI0024BF3E39|nr:GAF domain-containing protein [Halostagnicola sp. A-GB9-2]MDJ1434059.1 GAF domain-containing protein [Halostagnicola sp. A-GB9-2]
MNDERNGATQVSDGDEELTAQLYETIEEFDCTSGTLHRKEGDSLNLIAHKGIPESVLARTKTIPIGKGMAGIAAERMEPVEVCNLQTDDSGVAESRARDTGMEGSIAAPIISSDGELVGTIGIAKPDTYEFTTAEREQLMQIGTQIADRL